jgi:choline dehydrogenase
VAQFDYVIIGAGSAGCVLADKLTADGRFQVLLIEAGPSDRRFWVQMPIGYGASFNDPAVNWRYHTETESGLDGRQLYWPRGKVIGGSSAINALVYHRGQPADYDDWAAAGNPGWDYASLAPVFDAFEDLIRIPTQTPQSGKLTVSDVAAQYHPIGQRFLAMANELGFAASPDGKIMGEGIYPYCITTRKGVRCSSSRAFLHPALARPNLTVMTQSHVMRIRLDNGRVVGVTLRQHGRICDIAAGREILLAAGAVNSPQILQLSGIGPGRVLKRCDIPVQLDQPHVGRHLSDHLGINYYHAANRPTLNNVLASWPRLAVAGLQYFLVRRGPFSLGVNQLGGLLRSRPDLAYPDMQLYINPVCYRAHQPHRRIQLPDRKAGFILSFNACRPHSRGHVEIAAPDPLAAPRITGNYLADPRDIEDAVWMARVIARMQKSASVAGLLAAPPETPLAEMSEDAIVADFRARSNTVFHPCGTCRMGPDAAHAVVDPQLRVHGVAGLRVIDASVFPNITSTNLNAPAMMLAHRAAQLILAAR